MPSPHTNPPSHADSAWKDALRCYFPQFMQLFFADLAEKIDWNAGFEILDKEMQAVTTDALIGKRLVDMLFKVRSIEGKDCVVCLHVDIQGAYEAAFAERMYVYNYLVFNLRKLPVMTLVVLADNRRHWRPTQYKAEIWGKTITVFNFEMIKLLDWEGREAELLEQTNPFGVIVAVHLAAQKTKKDPAGRYDIKFSFIRRLYRKLSERGFTQDDIRNLYRFMEWIMTLPEDLNLRYHEDIRELEKRQKVEILTGFEQIGMQKGLQAGIQQGMQASYQDVWQTARRAQSMDVAKKMLARGLDKEFVKDATGLIDLDLLNLEDDLAELE